MYKRLPNLELNLRYYVNRRLPLPSRIPTHSCADSSSIMALETFNVTISLPNIRSETLRFFPLSQSRMTISIERLVRRNMW